MHSPGATRQSGASGATVSPHLHLVKDVLTARLSRDGRQGGDDVQAHRRNQPAVQDAVDTDQGRDHVPVSQASRWCEHVPPFACCVRSS